MTREIVRRTKTVVITLFAAAVGCPFNLSLPEARAASEKVVWYFASSKDGVIPVGGLINVNGTLYGTTQFGGLDHYRHGTVFSFNPATGAEKVAYSFCSQTNCVDGAWPETGLTSVNDTIFGTTEAGGQGGGGTVFALDPKTGVEQVLHSFCSQTNCWDGRFPGTSLTNVNGYLYGTTVLGGVAGVAGGCDMAGCGTVFSINPATGAEKLLYSFCSQKNCVDGAKPWSALVADPNAIRALYGATSSGGTYGDGTVFELDSVTGVERVLHSFGSGTDGKSPLGNLIEVNGELCGTTNGGGTFSMGAVFSLNPNTGEEVVLYSFCSQQNCADGATPDWGVINVNGKLYGTTPVGGSAACTNYGASCGAVFSIDLHTGAEKVLHSFCIHSCRGGRQPESGLINVNGVLYGTTIYGGIHDNGTVFALTPQS